MQPDVNICGLMRDNFPDLQKAVPLIKALQFNVSLASF